MVLRLVEMDREDFARRRVPMQRDYAASLVDARGLTPADAATESERRVDERAPRGPATPGQLMRKAVADGAEVGWIWVSLPGPALPDLAWIAVVEVDAEHRSRGHAAAIIEAIAAELAARGVPRLGLNVFGTNGTAIRLYERLGFEVTAQQRSRALGAPPATPGAGSGGVELVPIMDFAGRLRELVAEHARHLIQTEGLWHGEAEERAARKIEVLLPRGPHTEGAILRTVLAAGRPIGWLWVGLPTPERPDMGWLHSIDIDEGHRSRGHGRAAIAAVEAEMLRRGVPSLGLDVHGDNDGARRLYERLGYAVFAQQMVKELA